MTEKTLDLLLAEYAADGRLPFHMPGAKRRTAAELCGENGASLFPAGLLPASAIDITEIDGFDNLHRPEGLLRELETDLADLYGAKGACLSVGGSTTGLLSALCALACPGQEVLIARNCHAAVYHGALVQGLSVSYLVPEKDGTVSVSEVRQALEEHPAAVAAVITCPTYEGFLSDVAGIGAVLHEKGCRLLVDAAHGAHLGLSEEAYFPPHPIAAGADIAVTSLHKTLPALTMTAAVLWNDPALAEGVRRQMDIFETSSPSYVLMSSVAESVRLIRLEGRRLFGEYAGRLRRFYDRVRDLTDPYVLLPEEADPVFPLREGDGGPGARYTGGRTLSYPHRDPGKIVIISKKDIIGRLRDDYDIELEMASHSYALAMTSIADRDEWLDALADALIDMNDRRAAQGGRPAREDGFSLDLPFGSGVALPEAALPIREAFYAESEEVPLKDAGGRVAAAFVSVFPPEIPLLVPGEIIGRSEVDLLETASARGLSIHGLSPKGFVACVKNIIFKEKR